jgi:hypothetical protein
MVWREVVVSLVTGKITGRGSPDACATSEMPRTRRRKRSRAIILASAMPRIG